MKRSCCLLLIVLLFNTRSFSQYWQQEVNYRIDVTLNDTAHSLSGFEKIEYINHSPDTLRFIWFHCWPNAYKNDRTAFSDQLLENGNTKFYFSGKDEKGYLNQLDFKVNGMTALTEDHPQHIDVIKVLLPKPLVPGGKIEISTPFHVKLPYNFSRSGHDGQSYQAAQWYPKPAVYDAKGWHPLTYLDQGEFYADYGNFDVRITTPANYVIAATGVLQDDSEMNLLKDPSQAAEWKPVRKKVMLNGQLKWTTDRFPPSDKRTKSLHYKQDKVHDFAWFADKRWIIQADTCKLSSGKIVNVQAYYLPDHKETWRNAVLFAKRALRSYSEWVGDYPYQVVSVVEGPESFGGGMEYPTITILSPETNVKELDLTIAHEVGHNWFYGILGSNEREYPWMDEGINSFYEYRYRQNYYGDGPNMERLNFQTLAAIGKDQPISTHSEMASVRNYELVIYYKTGTWLKELSDSMGTDRFDRAMQAYFEQWKFKHPQPVDLQTALEKSSGLSLGSHFAKLNSKGPLPSQLNKGSRLALLFDIASLKKYIKQPSKDLYLLGPAIGVNSYDKLMAGVFLTNMKLPPSRFQFLLAPVYGTGSKKFGGTGLAFFSAFPKKGMLERLEIGVNAAAFSIDQVEQQAGPTLYPGVQKFVPGIKLSFRENTARSTIHKYLQIRSFLIKEDGLRFFRDTLISGTDTSIVNRFRLNSSSFTLNQLQFVIENTRVLYPYRGELKLEQGKDFIRAGFTGNYFFNYPKGGGLDLRLFAGKFFYSGAETISKRFATDRYHLNLTGANGYEDYTYSDYFPGRNEFEKLPSQQIMIRDGAFKIRTDLLASKVGKTDDWLMAVNLNTSIPDVINPLTILPFRLPLKLFVDIGTVAESWQPNAESDRFLYDAGVQVSLAKGLVNIYMPLIYSKVFKDYVQSTLDPKKRFWQKLSFSIDISHFDLRKFDPSIIY